MIILKISCEIDDDNVSEVAYYAFTALENDGFHVTGIDTECNGQDGFYVVSPRGKLVNTREP